MLEAGRRAVDEERIFSTILAQWFWRAGKSGTALLSELRPGLLVIDEIHSLWEGTVREQARVQSVTGGITSDIFSVMSQLASTAIESGEERIVPGDVANAGSLRAVLGEPV